MRWLYKQYLKRFFDIILSLFAIIFLSPTLLAIALLVRKHLGKPIIFKQQRIGKDEQIFTMYKFRTMTDERNEHGELLPNADRMTRFGNFLRKTSLDELPEIFNILKGDMSIIGPRPLLVEYLPHYTEEEKMRHNIRPGLTGLAQINGRNQVEWDQRLQYDVEYVRNVAPLLDFKIFFKTIYKTIRSEDVVVDSTSVEEDLAKMRTKLKKEKVIDLRGNLTMPIYFQEAYGKLYEGIDGEELDVFRLESDLGTIQNMFIKREIPITIAGETYYDIITPYGYGGPNIMELKDENEKENLLAEYEKEFKAYCQKHKIVSEFIRFHPILKNHEDFVDIYDVEYMRKTIGTNLKDFDDPFQKEFSKSTRKLVRRRLREGMKYEIITEPDNLDEFIEIYRETMDRTRAEDYYYFSDKYFNDILEHLRDQILVVNAIHEGKVIGTELIFLSGKSMHAHLGGTRTEYLDLSPNYVTMYGLTVWGKEHGYEVIHAGGGLTNDESDSLLKFKRRFSNHTEYDYYIGKKIWDEQIYELLCEANNVVEEVDFFPTYRLSA